jgi:lipoate-protein ligase A
MIFLYSIVTDGTWRLVDSGPLPSAESAAVDEAILESHADGGVRNTLHFYARSEPTVSLGYFQKASEAVDLQECARRGVRLVRRRSGGSAIFTDPGQLIYALVLPSSLVGAGEGSFSAVCNAIARALSTFGVAAEHRPVNDIEVGGRKISGSAQLRRHGSVLQHGTILVDADMESMDAVLRHGRIRPSERVTTLSRLIGTSPDMDVVKAAIADELARCFSISFENERLTEREHERVETLACERYGREEWNLRF